MKILISNDDGIQANGISALSEALGECNEVYVIAPDRERSAAGHSLTLSTPLRVDEVTPLPNAKRSWSTTGTPSDCIKIALSAILSKEEQPDIIISGINHGSNLGFDTLYSGTVSCAVEGSLTGIPSIAISLSSSASDIEAFKPAAKFMATLLPMLETFKFPPKAILNINFPSVPPEDIGGVSITQLGSRMYSNQYEKRTDPRGKTYYWLAGEMVSTPPDEHTDIAAIRNNRISITPMTFDMTQYSTMEDLSKILCSHDVCEWFK